MKANGINNQNKINNGENQKLKKNILILTIITLCFVSLNLFGQDENSNITKNENVTYNQESNTQNGYWKLYKTKFDIFSDTKSTDWIKLNGVLRGTEKWTDASNMEHTLTCSYSWNKPSGNLIPGDVIKLDGNCTNNDYSTSQNVASGIHIMMEKNRENFDILNIRKSGDITETEIRSGSMVIPTFKECNKGVIHIIVNCYIEKYFYTTTYTYVWVESTTNSTTN